MGAKAPKSPICCPHVPTYCLVGDDELDNGEGVEHSDGGDVPVRGMGRVSGGPQVRTPLCAPHPTDPAHHK